VLYRPCTASRRCTRPASRRMQERRAVSHGQVAGAELVCTFEELRQDHGRAAVDGKQFYTQDDKPSHESNVLGEGWRDRPRREAGRE
jgi:hypothetical protein